MKIGCVEIQWVRDRRAVGLAAVADSVDRTGVFAVANNEPWWLAVQQVIDEAEQETIQGARNRVSNTNQCISAIGAGEGCALVRQKLIDKREIALKEVRGDAERNEGAQSLRRLAAAR